MIVSGSVLNTLLSNHYDKNGVDLLAVAVPGASCNTHVFLYTHEGEGAYRIALHANGEDTEYFSWFLMRSPNPFYVFDDADNDAVSLMADLLPALSPIKQEHEEFLANIAQMAREDEEEERAFYRTPIGRFYLVKNWLTRFYYIHVKGYR